MFLAGCFSPVVFVTGLAAWTGLVVVLGLAVDVGTGLLVLAEGGVETFFAGRADSASDALVLCWSPEHLQAPAEITSKLSPNMILLALILSIISVAIHAMLEHVRSIDPSSIRF